MKSATQLKSKKNVSATIETITPEIATKLLKGNVKNRKLNDRTIAQYAKNMTDGEWGMNGETIKFSKDGKLLDGQHRLQAIINSGTTQDFLVIRGLDDDDIYTIDIGKNRNNSDALALAGYPVRSFILAAAINTCISFRNGNTYIRNTKDGKTTPTECLAFIQKNPGILHSLEKFEGNAAKLRGWVQPSAVVGLHFMFSKIDQQKANTFFYGLIEGANLQDGSPILALRNRLFIDQQAKHRGDGSRRRTIALIVKAFNYFLGGRTDVKLLKYLPEFPITLGQLEDEQIEE